MSIFPGRTSEWALLTANLPRRSAEPLGILLVDALDQLHVRLRSDWSSIAPDDEFACVWRALEDDLAARGRDLGGTAVLNWLEDSASHALQLGERHPAEVTDVTKTLEALYDQYAARAECIADAQSGGHRTSCAMR